ncbi:MAG TPA: hypothetical protein VFM74_04405, partial [Candidatus Limnocylindria bacterium]|nr:hypothetical protein [Candidatus Limnocylindria bacterium]
MASVEVVDHASEAFFGRHLAFLLMGIGRDELKAAYDPRPRAPRDWALRPHTDPFQDHSAPV